VALLSSWDALLLQDLQHTPETPITAAIQAGITTALYKIDVNVIGKYLSGAVIVKNDADSSLRMGLFQ